LGRFQGVKPGGGEKSWPYLGIRLGLGLAGKEERGVTMTANKLIEGVSRLGSAERVRRMPAAKWVSLTERSVEFARARLKRKVV